MCLCSRRWIQVAIFCAVGFQLLAGADERTRFFKPGAVKVLILTGRGNHDWRTSTPYLRKLLVETGRFDVRVCEEPGGITGETLAPYDVIVVDYGGPRWGDVTEKAVESFVSSGRGMVAVHGASYMFSGLELLADGHARTGIKEAPWQEYGRMIGGSWYDVPPKRFHGQQHSFQVKIVKKDHPIVGGMPAAFTATDELYHQMRFLPSTLILATAFDDPKMGGTGQDEPMLCANEYGRGRVFYTALGHDLAAMKEPGFINTFVRGTEWAATGKVTLPPNVAAARPGPPPVRVLVVTGGHDYETSFYSLFEGNSDLIRAHAASNTEAFRSDIRGTYDTLVFYDMSASLDEKGRANLKSFVESGKGIVVLHHAIADYQDWPWWYREVVGGRYLLQPDAGMPASTYKQDEELFVTKAMDHPITAGIGPMHLWDETYKGMWISPEVKVLLKTDNPTSDPSVAWISPYPNSRVVYIQLGHDHVAHTHPAYRALVHNAILWSSGRLNAANR